MKKLALLPILFFLTVAAHAQEKYVEVVVSDTLLVEPQEWFVHLNIEKNYDYSMMVDTVVTYMDTVPSPPPPPAPKPVELPGTTLAQLTMLVKKYGGRVLNDTLSISYSVVPDKYESDKNTYLNASFGNRKSLESFLRAAAQLGDVESEITGATNPKIQDFHFALEKKLMTAAKQKAFRLAELGGGKIGGVLVISEVVESESGWLKNFIETMVKMDFDRKSYARYLNSDKIKLEKSLKVRFAIL